VSTKETAEERDRRLELERNAHEIASVIGPCCEPGTGFALFVFDMGVDPDAGGAFCYVSNADRASLAKALRELLDRWDRGIG
jgi:hypothetical protein